MRVSSNDSCAYAVKLWMVNNIMRGSFHLILILFGFSLIYGWVKDNSGLFFALWWVILAIVPIATILGFIYESLEKNRYVKFRYQKPVWFGEMKCNKCLYNWKSRRDTPPAKCASCNSRDIGVVNRQVNAIGKVAISDINSEDYKSLMGVKVITGYPTWLFIFSLLSVFELIYLYAVFWA